MTHLTRPHHSPISKLMVVTNTIPRISHISITVRTNDLGTTIPSINPNHPLYPRANHLSTNRTHQHLSHLTHTLLSPTLYHFTLDHSNSNQNHHHPFLTKHRPNSRHRSKIFHHYTTTRLPIHQTINIIRVPLSATPTRTCTQLSL